MITSTSFECNSRYLYLLACLVGQIVNVTLKNNIRITGTFVSSTKSPSKSDNADVLVVLKYARVIANDESLNDDTDELLIISGRDIATLHVFSTIINEKKFTTMQNKFLTDNEISKNIVSDRRLEKWKPADDIDSLKNMSLDEKLDKSTWDQFEVNARCFKVKTTYQEDLYTTPLNIETIPQCIKERANQIAREIETNQSWRIDDGQDEEIFNGSGKSFDTNLPYKEIVNKTKTKLASTDQCCKQSKPDSLLSKALKAVKQMDETFLKSSTKLLPSRQGCSNFQNNSYEVTSNSNFIKNINALNLETARIRHDLYKSEIGNKQAAILNKVAWSKNFFSSLDRATEKKKFLRSLKVLTIRINKIDWSQASKTLNKLETKEKPSLHISKKPGTEFVFFERSSYFNDFNSKLFAQIILSSFDKNLVDCSLTWTRRLKNQNYSMNYIKSDEKLKNNISINLPNERMTKISNKKPLNENCILKNNSSKVKDTVRKNLLYNKMNNQNWCVNNSSILSEPKILMELNETSKVNSPKNTEQPRILQITQPKILLTSKNYLEKQIISPKTQYDIDNMQHLVLWPCKCIMSYYNPPSTQFSMNNKEPYADTQSLYSCAPATFNIKTNSTSFPNPSPNQYISPQYISLSNKFVLVPSAAFNNSGLPLYNDLINNNRAPVSDCCPFQLIPLAASPSKTFSETRDLTPVDTKTNTDL